LKKENIRYQIYKIPVPTNEKYPLRYGIYDKPKVGGSGRPPAPPEDLSLPPTIILMNIAFVESILRA
jgi:hypothetical protein